MAGRVRIFGVLLLAAGCRGPEAVRVAVQPRPSIGAVETELPAVTPGKIEPEFAALPLADLAAKLPPSADPSSFRGLTDSACGRLAAKHSAIANALDAENARDDLQLLKPHACPKETDPVTREARFQAAVEARNRAAAEALDRFYQLADAEARAELLARALTTFDLLRAELAKLRAAGLPAPDDAEMVRRRAKLLADAAKAEAGVALLNIDLKVRLGLPSGGPERLWPAGDFGVPGKSEDAADVVAEALANRADLRGLRGLYLGLGPASLAAARGQLRGTLPAPPGAGRTADALAAAEVMDRKKQLFELIADREAAAAAEVRAAVVNVTAAVRRVALARAAAETLPAKPGGKPAEMLAAELELFQARAEVVAEVMAYHRARVQLRAAAGRLADGK